MKISKKDFLIYGYDRDNDNIFWKDAFKMKEFLTLPIGGNWNETEIEFLYAQEKKSL